MVPREFNPGVGVGLPGVAVRSGMHYYGSRYLLQNLGMSTGVAGPLAVVLTGLEVAYVE